MKKIITRTMSGMLCLMVTVVSLFIGDTQTINASVNGNRLAVYQSEGYTDASAGQLHVSGANLVDKDGNKVQLRGISTHGLSWFPEYVNEKCFKQMHDDWKANVVRLAMYSSEYNGYCTGDESNKEKLKTLVKAGVQYADNNNMYVIVDWHILSDGDPMTNVSEAEKFWNSMSADLASYDNVIYEICNEPNGGGNWDQIKKYANRVIPIIRKNDPESVIIVGTPTWSQELDKAVADPLDYENIMYTLHFYAATHSFLRESAENAIKGGLPVFVTEFGICEASGNGTNNVEEGNKWIEMLDNYQVSYVAWNLSNKDEKSALISSQCSKHEDFKDSDLSESGKWFIGVLRDRADNGGEDNSEDADKNDTPSDEDTSNGEKNSNNSSDKSTNKKKAKKRTRLSLKKKTYTCKKNSSKSRRFNIKCKANCKTKLTYKKLHGNKNISVSKNGRIKVNSKIKKGSYKVTIKVKSHSTSRYKASSQKFTIIIKVK